MSGSHVTAWSWNPGQSRSHVTAWSWNPRLSRSNMYTCANGSAWRGANRRYISWWAASLQAISRNQPSTTDRPTANDQITYTCTHRRGEVPTAVIITHGGPRKAAKPHPCTKTLKQCNKPQQARHTTDQQVQTFKQSVASSQAQPTDRPEPSTKG